MVRLNRIGKDEGIRREYLKSNLINRRVVRNRVRTGCEMRVFQQRWKCQG